MLTVVPLNDRLRQLDVRVLGQPLPPATLPTPTQQRRILLLAFLGVPVTALAWFLLPDGWRGFVAVTLLGAFAGPYVDLRMQRWMTRR